MLQIKDIRKTYVTGELVQTALDGVSLNLRDNEFVAILGPSGSGKTTLLNVIGGLDRYDSGDLVINGISTKKYTDRDWDSYRNHTIGFVFQSYNLIPHQTVLANVELALTISGISRAERRRRAAKALEDVGLGNQLHKKPNQMSGGQMQRVAIARALVNDPDILLADEPTGALDTATSVQVMELLKEVSRNRLVVMVTHNPELAEEYANRIVRVKDGRIIDDTNPCVIDDTSMEPPKHKNMGRSSMSPFTALALSFNNLRTKKARTLLTAFAGSIGIIGIALIMSLSTGFQKYIDKIQADTLSNYPLTIQTETADMASAMAAFGASIAASREAETGTVVEQQMITQMFAQIGANDLASFKVHLEENYGDIGHTINTVKYSYGITPRIYLADTSDGIKQANPATLFDKLMGNSMMAMYMGSNVFYEMIDDRTLLDSQYDVVRGRWPESYNEMIVVLTDPSQITDYMAYTLGLKDADLLQEMIRKVMGGEDVESLESMEWTYEDLMNLQLRLVSVPELYRYNEEYAVWEDLSDDQTHMETVIAAGEQLQIVGIVCPKEGVSATALSAGVAYTSGLTRHVIADAAESQIVQMQLADQNINVFTGKGFHEESDAGLNFQDMITVDGNAISSAFGMDISTESIMQMLRSYMGELSGSLNVDTSGAELEFVETFASLGRQMLTSYVEQNADESGAAKIYLTDGEMIVDAYLADSAAQEKISAIAAKYGLPEDGFTQVYRPLLTALVSNFVANEMDAGLVPPEEEAGDESEEEIPMETEGPEETPSATETPEAPEAAVQSPANTEAEITMETETVIPETTEQEPPAVTEPELPAEPEPPVETNPPEESPEQPEKPEDTESEPPAESEPDVTLPTLPELPEMPDIDIEINPDRFYGELTAEEVDGVVQKFVENPVVTGTAAVMGRKMMEPVIRNQISNKISEFGGRLAGFIGSSIRVDGNAIANAFQFNMDEQQLQRLMAAMSGQSREVSAAANLQSLGYAQLENPTAMSIYLVDFAAKEEFMAFLDSYNEEMSESGKEEQVIRYTDVTGMMMSSVRTIIDSVSYALIAFVAVSLVVSSIMIGIITYISVMERTKEIGILRAIGASKANISQVFNAETFIIGLCSGLIGIGITLLLLIPGNYVIHYLTENPDIVAQLPAANALVLIGLSVVLTLIGGFIPAKKAAKKDPVIALRSE